AAGPVQAPDGNRFLWRVPAPSAGLARYATDLRAQHLQFLFDALVATVYVVDAIDQGVALGDQRRNDQAGRSPQVGGHDRGTLEGLGAGDGGSVAFDLDLRAHAVHLVHVHEAVCEDRLDHRAGVFGNGVEGDELSLHVGRERRVRGGAQVHGFRPLAVHV